MLLVHDFLRDAASRWPDKTALVAEDDVCTFARLDRDSDRLAFRLQQSGLCRGDRVVIMLENSIALVVSLFGVVKAGGVFVLVHPSVKAEKLGYLLNDCGARALIGAAHGARIVAPAAKQAAALETLIWTDSAPAGTEGGHTFGQILSEPGVCPSDPGLIDKDLCTIIYTSGSTGEPKGVMLTHHNMTNTAWAISTYLGNAPDDVIVCVLPLSFDYGLYQVITGARVGFTVLLERSFTYPYDVLKRMAQYRVTGLPGVPTIFATLLQMAPLDGLDLSSLRFLTNTAAPFPPAHIHRLQALFPQARIFSMYGLTECTRVSYLPPERLADKILSVGKAMPNSEVYIIDQAGRRVGPGTVGELVVRGANVMLGYWGKPEETARCLRDGELQGEKVLHTGDQFRMDKEGFLHFQGRKDDIFKSKGMKISPREIENILYELDVVGEAAVIGVPDTVEGHAIKACVVPRPGFELTEVMIRQHCRARLEAALMPKFVEIRASIPKTETGKLKKMALA
jgi:long-chain acyl-CoA synthetase